MCRFARLFRRRPRPPRPHRVGGRMPSVDDRQARDAEVLGAALDDIAVRYYPMVKVDRTLPSWWSEDLFGSVEPAFIHVKRRVLRVFYVGGVVLIGDHDVREYPHPFEKYPPGEVHDVLLRLIDKHLEETDNETP